MSRLTDPYKAAAAERAKKPRERVVFEIDADLIAKFDQWAAGSGKLSRADALRGLVTMAVTAAEPGSA